MKNKRFITELAVILVLSLIITVVAFARRTAAAETGETAAVETEDSKVTETTEDETEDVETASGAQGEAVEVDLTDATSFEFSDTDIVVSEGAYTGYQIEGTALTIKDSGV